MDFIEELPGSKGKEVILVVVDKFNKYSHFMALTHPNTTSTVAKVFLDNVFKLHCFLATIMSERDQFFKSVLEGSF
jgi:inorganic pyrophosphatase/exopolyphosphatase